MSFYFFSSSFPSPSSSELSDYANDTYEHPVALDLASKGINIGHLIVQGICGERFSKILLTLPEYINFHIFGLSETKLKDHKSTEVFKINGFQTPFRKNNDSNGGGGLLVYIRNSINAK